MSALTACPDGLDREQLERYRDEGYVAFADLLTRAEVADAGRALEELARRGAGAPYLLQEEPGLDPVLGPELDPVLRLRKLMGFADHHPVLARLLSARTCDRRARRR